MLGVWDVRNECGSIANDVKKNSKKNAITIGFYLHCKRKSCIINTYK